MLSYNFYQYSVSINPLMFDDGHGDYNRSYERDYDDFDYADYSTDHRNPGTIWNRGFVLTFFYGMAA